MNPALKYLLGFSGVALLYRKSLLSNNSIKLIDYNFLEQQDKKEQMKMWKIKCLLKL